MSKTEYKGIDYGLGRSNKNPLTAIRYGVISQNEVLQTWCGSSEPIMLMLMQRKLKRKTVNQHHSSSPMKDMSVNAMIMGTSS